MGLGVDPCSLQRMQTPPPHLPAEVLLPLPGFGQSALPLSNVISHSGKPRHPPPQQRTAETSQVTLCVKHPGEWLACHKGLAKDNSLHLPYFMSLGALQSSLMLLPQDNARSRLGRYSSSLSLLIHLLKSKFGIIFYVWFSSYLLRFENGVSVKNLKTRNRNFARFGRNVFTF